MTAFLFAISGLLTAITCFALALLILIRSPRLPVNRLMTLFNLCCALWGIGIVQVGLARSAEQAIWGWRIAHVGGFFLGTVFFQLSGLLIGKQRSNFVTIAHAVAAVGGVLVVQGIAMSEIWHPFGPLHYHRANAIYSVIVAGWAFFVIWGHVQLFAGYQRFAEPERTRLRFITWAWAIGFVGGTSTLLPQFGVLIPPYGNFSIPVYAFVVTYAITKHGLLDVQLVITRTTLWLATYLVILALPFAVGVYGRAALEAHLGSDWWLVPVVVGTLLATVGPGIYAALRHKAEERLLRSQRAYQTILRRAARNMTQVRSIGKLSRLITGVVSHSVRVAHASLFLWDEASSSFRLVSSHGPSRPGLRSQYCLDKEDAFVRHLASSREPLTTQFLATQDSVVRERFEELQAAVVVPGVMEEKVIGFIVLGPKLSGAGYSSDDMHAFETLAYEAAIAIDNALAYEELAKTNEYLRAVTERLLHQEKLAAVGQFAAGMAHEIKNPLSAIKTFAEFLPDRYEDADFRGKFSRIVQSEIERINGIVRQLLDLAKPAPLELQQVDLGRTLQDMATLLSNQCMKQGIEVAISVEERGLILEGDPAQLKQVALNLLMNAIEAMEKGGRLSVACQKGEREIVLCISDSGAGITPENLKHIWDPFFTTKARGMGLGLAVVRDIIERHAGHIAIKSGVGEGTRVDIRLPIHQPAGSQ